MQVIRGKLAFGLLMCAGALACAVPAMAQVSPAGAFVQSFPNPAGTAATVDIQGPIDDHGPFFQNLGTNGRSCASCHVAGDGWSITPTEVRARFDASQGMDPLFRPVDGGTSPNADVSNLDARRAAYRLLLTKGLIRIGLPMPANADFTLQSVDDPYHFASAQQLSLFRRPLPTTNLAFLTSVMWDGRESPAGRSLGQDLTIQAGHAASGHEQTLGDLSAAQLQQIVSFESSLFSAQLSDGAAGDLSANGASGGPLALASQAPGVDANGQTFTLFQAWAAATPAAPQGPPGAVQPGRPGSQPPAPQRRRLPGLPGLGGFRLLEAADNSNAGGSAIARGEAIFNSRRFRIDGVAGLNDVQGGPVTGTCSTCHNAANVGSHATPVLFNIGTADASRRTPDLPLYTFSCATSQTIRVTDPGEALISGKCADMGKFSVPVLRNLSARAPYFHNGSAASLDDVIEFYRRRFRIRLSAADSADLAAFLAAL